ncbi:MAG TPA: 3-hydroxyacyl-CoA dehydrogenase NAD-binding domain-containing protein, partial [Saprospiraceae bacterium]|nr:3-hydroxyacyl-CoA dehydrogenase NAD-binding domain-containing protein [Saprospiraceae bacterium]
MHHITVIGGGTMGNGIAHVFAQYGFNVTLVDVAQAALDKAQATISKNLDRQVSKGTLSEADKAATLGRLNFQTDLAAGVQHADLVVEAATENVTLKLKIFADLDQMAPAGCILATNTSSISITKIAAATKRPDKVIGMHFMNPVPVMKLVEVIRGYASSDEVTTRIMDLSRQLEKVPVEVNDYPGFVANRILMPMINEAIYTLYEGVSGVEEIDTVMKLGMAHPMGPLQLADFIGLDVCLAILRVLHDGFGNPKYAPCPLLALQRPELDRRHAHASIVTRIDVTLSLSQPAGGAPGALPVARPSGRLLAMAIIDPAADVRYADPAMPYDPLTQLGPQRWGFYAQYLLAYLDGGYIPQQIVHRAGDPADRVRLLSQDLYYPSMHIVDAKGTLGKGDVGQGFDLIQHRRGEDGYSPVCRVLAFDPK